MSANNDEAGQTYRIETKVSAGSIVDPVTDETHNIDPKEDDRGGFIEVSRPDSARYLVNDNTNMGFVGSSPSESAVREAQQEEFGFGESDLALAFASSRGKTLGTEDLDAEAGFDPAEDDILNDRMIRSKNVYESLTADGRDDVAGYLRHLPSLSRQYRFIKFLEERGEL